MSKCTLETHPEHGGCCCICKHHVIDASHPETDGGRIMSQRGWVCVAFLICEAEPVVFSNWSEHGMCELFEPEQRVKKILHWSKQHDKQLRAKIEEWFGQPQEGKE